MKKNKRYQCLDVALMQCVPDFLVGMLFKWIEVVTNASYK